MNSTPHTITVDGYGNFTMDVRDDNYINATTFCRSIGKRFSNYYLLRSTKGYIETVSQSENIPTNLLVQIATNNLESTWCHPDIAIHLGRWADQRLEYAINRFFRLRQPPPSKVVAEPTTTTLNTASMQSIITPLVHHMQQSNDKCLQFIKELIREGREDNQRQRTDFLAALSTKHTEDSREIAPLVDTPVSIQPTLTHRGISPAQLANTPPSLQLPMPIPNEQYAQADPPAYRNRLTYDIDHLRDFLHIYMDSTDAKKVTAVDLFDAYKQYSQNLYVRKIPTQTSFTRAVNSLSQEFNLLYTRNIANNKPGYHC
jgi:hypothetical protein